jgi:hypothetical protein
MYSRHFAGFSGLTKIKYFFTHHSLFFPNPDIRNLFIVAGKGIAVLHQSFTSDMSAILRCAGSCQGKDFHPNRTMALQHSGALANRRSSGENVIDQTDDCLLRQTAGSHLKGTSEIFSPLDPTKCGLGRSIPHPDQPIRPDHRAFLRKKQTGQDRCLIESPPAVPIQVEGDRNNPLAVGKRRQITPPNDIREPGENRGVSSIFQLLHKLPDRRFVTHQGPGETIGRWKTETFTAEVVSFLLAGQFHPADPAERPAQITDTFPTTAAKQLRTTRIKSHPTYWTYRRKE